MKKLLWLIPFLAVLGTPLLAGTALDPSQAGRPTIYLRVAAYNDIEFDRYRLTNDGRDLVYDTIRKSGAAMAKAAGLNANLILLEGNEPSPEHAPVLRITWMGAVVDYLPASGGKALYLGKASRSDLFQHHPDHQTPRERLNRASLDERPLVRKELVTEMELYNAFGYLKTQLAKGA